MLPEDLQKIVGGREIAEKVLKRLVAEGVIWMDGDKRGEKFKCPALVRPTANAGIAFGMMN